MVVWSVLVLKQGDMELSALAGLACRISQSPVDILLPRRNGPLISLIQNKEGVLGRELDLHFARYFLELCAWLICCASVEVPAQHQDL